MLELVALIEYLMPYRSAYVTGSTVLLEVGAVPLPALTKVMLEQASLRPLLSCSTMEALRKEDGED